VPEDEPQTTAAIEKMEPVTVSVSGDRRRAERYYFECTVTASAIGRGKGHELKVGTLCNIGVGGACFRLDERLELGTQLRLQVHFLTPSGRTTTLLFEGRVVRARPAGPEYEIVLEFRRGGGFLRKAASRP